MRFSSWRHGARSVLTEICVRPDTGQWWQQYSSRSWSLMLSNTTVGVFLQQTTPGQGAAIVRGLKGSSILHLVDGMRLNNAIFPQRSDTVLRAGAGERGRAYRECCEVRPHHCTAAMRLAASCNLFHGSRSSIRLRQGYAARCLRDMTRLISARRFVPRSIRERGDSSRRSVESICKPVIDVREAATA